MKLKPENNVLIIGEGKSGEAAKNLLLKNGFSGLIINTKAKVKLKEYLYKKIIVSPGINITNKFFKRFKKYKIELCSELNYALEIASGKFFGITGTNGKTTTTYLLEHIFKTAELNAYAVGNCGNPFSKELTETGLDENNYYVIEISSFMLTLPLVKKLDSACILNFSSDHLDYHKTEEEYFNSKIKIFNSVKEGGVKILNYDDNSLRGWFNINHTEVNDFWFISCENKVKGMFLKDNSVCFSDDGENEAKLFDLTNVKILGVHNVQNILAASLMALLAEVPKEKIAEAVNSFNGVKHRQTFVRAFSGKVFINDSKGTNIDSTLTACKVYNGQVTLLLGGSDKGEDFKKLFNYLPKNVNKVVLYGASKNKLLKAAKTCGYEKIYEADNLESAVILANSISDNGTTILLSPACASFDEFNNYEERGNRFEEIVNKL